MGFWVVNPKVIGHSVKGLYMVVEVVDIAQKFKVFVKIG
jgi:hypothetical protein